MLKNYKINKYLRGNSLLLLPLFFIFSSLKSQVNLVPNPSFEQLDSCIVDFQNQFIWPYVPIQLATPWDTLKSGGGGNGGILCNECFNPNPSIGVPKNISGGGGSFQQPRTGKGYIYINFFKKAAPAVAWRFYSQTPLTTTLTSNKAYCVTFYASFSNRWITAIDELSAYFDDGSIQSVAPAKEALASPQIKSPSGVFMMDTLNWMKIQGSFVANGTESYLTLGNFRTDAATNYTILSGPGACEYYIDDVSVIELNLPAYAGPDKTIMLGDSTFIGRPPEIGLECTWYNGTVNIGSGAGIWVKPTVNTTYVVQQDICGLIKTDTVNVIVNYVGINENSVDSKFMKLYPNPTNGEFTLESTYANIELKEVEITDVTGRTVFKKEFKSSKTTLQPNLNNGIYFITLRVSNNETVTKKLIVSK